MFNEIKDITNVRNTNNQICKRDQFKLPNINWKAESVAVDTKLNTKF